MIHLGRLFRTIAFKKRVGSKNSPVLLGKVTIRGKPSITLGKNVVFYNNVIIWGDGELVFGDNCVIGDNVIFNVSKMGGIIIGEDTRIAANCYLIDSNHVYNNVELSIWAQGIESHKITIGSNSWIGANTTIVPKAIIGSHCVVGANSLVNNTIEDYCVSVGAPCKVIKKYSKKIGKWERKF